MWRGNEVPEEIYLLVRVGNRRDLGLVRRAIHDTQSLEGDIVFTECEFARFYSVPMLQDFYNLREAYNRHLNGARRLSKALKINRES